KDSLCSSFVGKKAEALEGPQVEAPQEYSLLPCHVLLVPRVPLCAECGAVAGGQGSSRTVP
ncbi:hypothetical protein V5799_002898, partial [Amblyomma americanum]